MLLWMKQTGQPLNDIYASENDLNSAESSHALKSFEVALSMVEHDRDTHFGQGYYYARPMCADEAYAFLCADRAAATALAAKS